MKSNKFMKVTAAVMTAAMLAAAVVPASAAAPIGTTATQPTAAPTVVQEVYGDINGLYYDMGYTYSDGSYLIETPIPVGRLMKKWPFKFSINYKSDSTADNLMGNGIICTYNQKLVRNSESSFTYIDDKGISHDIWYDAYTGEAGSSEGPVSLVINEYRYELKFGSDLEKWFDPQTGDLSMYFTNTDPYDATRVYRNEDGTIHGAVCRDTSYFLFNYDTLADGSKRVSSIEYAENNSGTENRQIISFTYDEEGNLIKVANDTRIEYLPGYTYTYDGGKLVSANNNLYGGTLSVLIGPDNMPVISYQRG